MPSLQSALAEHETASYADSVLSDQSTTRVGIPDTDAVPSDDRAPDDHKSRASVGYDLSRFDQRETVRDARLSEARNVPKRKRKTAARAKFSALTLMLCVVTALLSVALAGLLYGLSKANAWGWGLRSVEATAEPDEVPMLWRRYAYRVADDLSRVDPAIDLTELRVTTASTLCPDGQPPAGDSYYSSCLREPTDS